MAIPPKKGKNNLVETENQSIMTIQVVRKCKVTIDDWVGRQLSDEDWTKLKSLSSSFKRRRNSPLFSIFGSGNTSVVLKGQWEHVQEAVEYLEEKYGAGTYDGNADSGAFLLENQTDINRSNRSIKSSKHGKHRAKTPPRAQNVYHENPRTFHGGARPKVREPQTYHFPGEGNRAQMYTPVDTKPLSVTRLKGKQSPNDNNVKDTNYGGATSTSIESFSIVTPGGIAGNKEALRFPTEKPKPNPRVKSKKLPTGNIIPETSSYTNKEADIQGINERLRLGPLTQGATADYSCKQVEESVLDKNQIDKREDRPIVPEKSKVGVTPPRRKKRKRSLTKTGQSFTLSSKTGGSYKHVYGQLIHVFIGDLTKLMVGSVVNASNPRLVHGGGVARAIKKAAGPSMVKECDQRVKKYGAIEISHVYASAAYKMPCQIIIHVAGPSWTEYSDKRQAEEFLYHSFLNCLLEAERLHQPSIAIPAVGSGIYGSPLAVVARQMYNAVQNFLTSHVNSHVRDILLVDINSEIVDLLINIMAKEAIVGHVSIIEPSYKPFFTGTTSMATNISQSQNVAAGSAALPTSGSSSKLNHVLNQCDSEESVTINQEGILTTLQGASSAHSANDDCAICMDKATDKVVLPNCGHVFCKECIGTWFKDKPTCPNCGQIYGEMRGDQPDGTMTVHKIVRTIPGYNDTEGAIVISYQFHDGIQQACHPNPGSPYYGTSRTGFLPDNEEGKHILSLLRRAFDARLTFTIGRSTTTGRDGQITWNDIHHKTNIYGGPERFGYPDPTYLSRVKEELAARGIK